MRLHPVKLHPVKSVPEALMEGNKSDARWFFLAYVIFAILVVAVSIAAYTARGAEIENMPARSTVTVDRDFTG